MLPIIEFNWRAFGVLPHWQETLDHEAKHCLPTNFIHNFLQRALASNLGALVIRSANTHAVPSSHHPDRWGFSPVRLRTSKDPSDGFLLWPLNWHLLRNVCFNPTEVSLTWVVLGPLEMEDPFVSAVKIPRKKNKRVPSFVNMLLTRWPKQGLMKIVESSCTVSIARGYFKKKHLKPSVRLHVRRDSSESVRSGQYLPAHLTIFKNRIMALQKAEEWPPNRVHYITFSARRAPTAISTPPSIHTPGRAASSASSNSHQSPTNHPPGPCFVLWFIKDKVTNRTNSRFKSKLQCHPSSGFHLFLQRLSKDSVDSSKWSPIDLLGCHRYTHHLLQVWSCIYPSCLRVL